MTSRRSNLVCLLAAGLFLTAGASAAPANLDSLVSNSPFGGQTAAGKAGPAEMALEFRGMVVDGGETFFSVFDSNSRTSLWVSLNEAGNPFTVQAYDTAKGAVTVSYQGRILTLPLKQSKVGVMAAVAPGALTTNSTSNGPKAVQPASAEDATRLAAVADEVRRRRALRAQQANTPSQPNPPPRD